MEKVIVIGCPGAGKSTFSRKLRDITGLPLYYLDMIWHKPDRTNVSKEEFDTQLGQLLERECWIIDGNYRRTIEPRLKACDTVFLLDFPLEVCLSGVESRMGQPREDMPWVEIEPDLEFRQWIMDFSQNVLPGIYELLEQYQEQNNIVIFKSRQEADDYLKKIDRIFNSCYTI